ncbi:N-acetylmuramoyl-L-alanine amidase [Alphaproteobacteria bacterium]|nr:N-acetylmuramoyl-L-alanine amidase [Alphaproteobacteria bacterium]
MLSKSNIKHLVIHCSDTPDDKNLTAKDIHSMHLSFGWNGIGYHKIIRRDGVIENGRPEYWIGAHAKGINNNSLGVCLIGRNNFTIYQYNSLEELINKWKKKYPEASIKGHCEAIKTDKTCPNFNVQSWCKERGLI